jgi:hypothetical protein
MPNTNPKLGQLYGLTAAQIAALGSLVNRGNSQSSKLRQNLPSTHRAGLAQGMIGKLTAAVTDTAPGMFQAYAAPNPDDPTSVAVATSDPSVACYSWGWASSTQVASGTAVTIGWMAGRWYLVDYPCPTPIGGGS